MSKIDGYINDSKDIIFTGKDKICRNFQMNKFNIKKIVPAVTMQVEINIDRLLLEREEINKTSDIHITIYSFLLKKIASVLIKYPLLFSLYYKNKIIINKTLIINIPVSIDKHVEYVFIKNPEEKSIKEITAELQNGITAIKDGKNLLTNTLIEMDKLNKIQALLYKMRHFKNPIYFLENFYGYFPITNFGTFNVTRGTMVLSEPIVAGLLIGKIKQNVAMYNDSIKEENVITFSLSFDHRVMDGSYAGHFLSEIKNEIEHNCNQ